MIFLFLGPSVAYRFIHSCTFGGERSYRSRKRRWPRFCNVLFSRVQRLGRSVPSSRAVEERWDMSAQSEQQVEEAFRRLRGVRPLRRIPSGRTPILKRSLAIDIDLAGSNGRAGSSPEKFRP